MNFLLNWQSNSFGKLSENELRTEQSRDEDDEVSLPPSLQTPQAHNTTIKVVPLDGDKLHPAHIQHTMD